MTVDIPATLRDKPKLMELIERVNAVVREELDSRHDHLLVQWRLDRSARPPGLALMVTDSTRCRAPFIAADVLAGPEAIRARIRQWCGRLVRPARG